MSSTASRKENERTKLIQQKCQTLLTQMLRDEDNKYCVDCDAKGKRDIYVKNVDGVVEKMFSFIVGYQHAKSSN